MQLEKPERADEEPTAENKRSEILFGQDPKLLVPANQLAQKIRALPQDLNYPEIEPRALLVGGFVRDSLIGTVSKDADIEVYGVSSKRLRSLLEQLFPGRVDTIGESFQALKIFLGDGLDLDVTIPRRDSKTGKGHGDFDITGDPGMSVTEAARRRDFTMNSIAADPLTGEIIDPFNGQADIKKKLIRATDPKHFADDALRVYRGVQFAARFGFGVVPETFSMMRELVERSDLDALSNERVTTELKKMLLLSERPSIGFELMRELGIIERYFPELHALIEVPQEPEWHPEGDVWIHTLMVLDAAAKLAKRRLEDGKPEFSDEERLQIILGALCHDLGKATTTKLGEKDGVPRIRSLGHEEAGVEPTKALLSRLTFGTQIEMAATAAAKDHLKPGVFYRAWEKQEMTDEGYANAVRKWIKRIHPVSWKVMLAVSEADHRGRAFPEAETEPYAPGELLARVVTERGLDKEATKPLVQGRDLLELGLKPGPHFTKIINEVEAARDEGVIKTRAEALEFVRTKNAL